MGAKRILALGSVAALCAGAAAPLFMASAASALPANGTDATFFCLPAGTPPSPVIGLIIDIAHGTSNAVAAGECAVLSSGALTVAVEVTGPIGAVGVAGPTGAAGGTGGTGGTGLKGNTGLKGAQGVTGPQGGSGGTGGVGGSGARGATGPQGASPTGPTGGNGGTGDTGLVGPQGPTGAQGATGPTATVLAPNTACPPSPGGLCQGVQPATVVSGAVAGKVALAAGPGMLGNTRTVSGNSQIILSCPLGSNILGGGAELLPGNADVRGILESSFPNPTTASHQWIVTAEVTATGTTADDPTTNFLQVIPWVNCR